MSAANISFIQTNIYANFETGNIEGVMSVFDDNIKFTHHGPRALIPFAGKWEGKAGAGQMLQTFVATTEPVYVEVNNIMGQGDTVIVLAKESYKVKATGKTYESQVAHIWKVANNKVVQFDELYDSAAIAEAFRAD